MSGSSGGDSGASGGSCGSSGSSPGGSPNFGASSSVSFDGGSGSSSCGFCWL